MTAIENTCNRAIVYADTIDSGAEGLIRALCGSPLSRGSAIRVMPDVHAGKGCAIGTTMTVADRAAPGLAGAVSFLRGNMRVDPETGMRQDIPEYPLDALREAVLNALVHRDYSAHTENMPIQLIMFYDRVVIRNPGGLYRRLTVDQLGKAQPDTRNPAVITAMEALGQTENRYSGIPRIRRAMAEAGLPEPVFRDDRWEFSVCLYNKEAAEQTPKSKPAPPSEKLPLDDHGLLDFCGTPRTRKKIVGFLGIASGQYALRRYLEPLVKSGMILLAFPDRPKSPKQTYRTNPDIRR